MADQNASVPEEEKRNAANKLGGERDLICSVTAITGVLDPLST